MQNKKFNKLSVLIPTTIALILGLSACGNNNTSVSNQSPPKTDKSINPQKTEDELRLEQEGWAYDSFYKQYQKLGLDGITYLHNGTAYKGSAYSVGYTIYRCLGHRLQIAETWGANITSNIIPKDTACVDGQINFGELSLI